MTFVRRSLVALSLVLLATAAVPCLGPALRAAAQSGPAQVSSSPAQQQAYTLPPDKLAKAVALSRIRNTLDIVLSLWGIAVLGLLLATRAAAGLEAWAQRVAMHRWIQGLLFFAALLIIVTLANLPFDIYGHYASVAYSISVEGWPSWFLDLAKSLGVTVLVGAPVLLLFNWIVRRWPRGYWLVGWLVTLPLMVAALFLEPLAEPIFNTYEPLARNHAALVEKLEMVAARTGTNIPPERMFLMKASEKTNGLNAYVSGIGATKRIVVWDTTAGCIPDDEIMLVFGHESGHYVLNHTAKMMAIGGAGVFFVFWACAGAAGWMAGRYGSRWGLSKPAGVAGETSLLASRAGFVVLILAVTIAGFLLQPATNAVSRHFEHEADVYGQEAIHGLVPDAQKTAVAGFNTLGEAWLDDPDPSPFIEFWLYDHPSVKNRANFAANYDPWANGGHGEFFDK